MYTHMYIYYALLVMLVKPRHKSPMIFGGFAKHTKDGHVGDGESYVFT